MPSLTMTESIALLNNSSSHDSSHSQDPQSPSLSPPAETSDVPASTTTKKRNSSAATLDSNGNPKTVKRRAAKACAACRARKVRCDVMQRYHVTAEGEVTCSNCTMDGIKCVIEESKRRKKHLQNAQPATNPPTTNTTNSAQQSQQNWANGVVNPSDITNPDARRWSGSSMSNDVGEELRAAHASHSLGVSDRDALRRQSFIGTPFDNDPTYSLLTSVSIHGDLRATRVDSPIPPAPLLKHKLPSYLKPLPPRMTSVDIDYLFAKGALSLPEVSVRNALLQSYVEYVHPYMPLIELHDLLQTINDGSGEDGKVSLLLFQAIMFAGTAFVDMEYLRAAGYSNRKAARKAFFQKARVLYDFDYEVDRVSLVQSLLLMTYWYETPDDQKDTWHWMGVAISLAHTIGLHRNPANSSMPPHKKKLWKRIWWSCFMRDRLVALGMRRPTRVKDEDYDVPMLEEDDFEILSLAEDNTIIGPECTLIRDVQAQRELAQMCIAKAKLCLCISHVLTAQYSVLVKHQGMQGQEGSTRSSVMLFPKKLDQTDEVQRCDEELSEWIAELPEACHYTNDGENGPIFVQRALLHMVYFTTLSALHRPQVLPSAATPSSPSHKLQDISRKKVREASKQITNISTDLHSRGLEKYLPTTGVTVLLPAIIIHLLDIKSCSEEARLEAMSGFAKCMAVLERLRDNYSSADFATQFLEAAIRKADIELAVGTANANASMRGMARAHTPPLSEHEGGRWNSHSGVGGMMMGSHALNGLGVVDVHTPPEHDASNPLQNHHAAAFASSSSIDTSNNKTHITNNNNTFLDPLDVFPSSTTGGATAADPTAAASNFDLSNINLNDFLNFDDGWNVSLEEGAHGESGGFVGDMNWVDSLPGWSRVGSRVQSRMGSPVPGF